MINGRQDIFKNNMGKSILILALFFFALALRLFYLSQYKMSPFFASPVIDALSHYIYACRLADGNLFGQGMVATRAPFYVGFLALIFKIVGTGYLAARVIQAMLGAFNCVLVYSLAKKIFNVKVAVLSSLICGIYGVLIYFDAEFLNVTLTIFLNLLLLLALLKTIERPSVWKQIGCGLLFGIALQTSANVILFGPLLFLWWFMFFSRELGQKKERLCYPADSKADTLPDAQQQSLSPRQRINGKNAVKSALFLFLGISLMILPFAVRNYLQGGEFVLISTTAGINLYIGNNPAADGKSAYPPTRDFAYSGWQDNVLVASTKSAYRAAGHKLSSAQISHFWMTKAFEFIYKNPAKAMELVMRKFYYFFNAYEIPENQSIYFFRIWSSLLKVLVFSNNFLSFPFGLICPLALLGIVVSVKKNRGVILIVFFILAHLCLMMIFFVCSRYRAVVIPYFIIFASYAVFWVGEQVTAKKFKHISLAALFFIFTFIFSNSALFGVKAEDDSKWFFNLGNAFRYKGKTESAFRAYKYANKLNPNNLDVLYNLGVLHLEKGRYPEAIKRFEDVIEKDPGDSAAYSNIGFALAKQNKTEDALGYYQKALALDSDDLGAMVNLAAAYVELEDLPEALSILNQAQRKDDNFAPLHNHLGVVHEKMGRSAAAEKEYLQALALNPEYFEAYQNLALLYKRMGRTHDSNYFKSKALELLPKKIK